MELTWHYQTQPYNYQAVSSPFYVIPKGTVLYLDRYHISSASKTEEITVKIWGSPNANIVPKKHGGKSQASGKLMALLADLNEIECEVYDGE